MTLVYLFWSVKTACFRGFRVTDFFAITYNSRSMCWKQFTVLANMFVQDSQLTGWKTKYVFCLLVSVARLNLWLAEEVRPPKVISLRWIINCFCLFLGVCQWILDANLLLIMMFSYHVLNYLFLLFDLFDCCVGSLFPFKFKVLHLVLYQIN